MRPVAILHQVFATTLALILVGCAAEPSRQTTPAPITEGPDPIEITAPEDASEFFRAELEMVSAHLDKLELIPAASLLELLDQESLSHSELISLRQLQIKLAYLQGRLDQAENLTEQSLSQFGKKKLEAIWPLHQWKIRLLRDRRDYMGSARYAVSLGVDTNEYLSTRVMTGIWTDLSRATSQDLSESQKLGDDPLWQGWVELAALNTRLPRTPRDRELAWQSWQQRFPEHPANVLQGTGLSAVNTAIPTEIALLLPMTGPLSGFSNAVIDGYLLAMMQAQEEGWPKQRLRIEDINRFADINEAQQILSQEGVELIVGPLTREKLAAWTPKTDSAPLLALNAVSGKSGPELFQFPLSPEEEASQLAQLAFSDGARHALIIQPEGNFGDDVYRGFINAWQARQGQISASASYSDRSTYSGSIEGALQLANSQSRANMLRRIFDEQIEFSPRRRHDIDSVFLFAANSEEARSLKPLLAFHYAGDLPVYATSHAMSDFSQPEENRDLNNLKLLQLPWVLEEGNRLRQQLINAQGREEMSAMHALGADAFLLHWRLQQMRDNALAFQRGYTGLISIGNDGRIRRELSPARVKGGVPIPQ